MIKYALIPIILFYAPIAIAEPMPQPAEAILPIRATILDCTTYETAMAECRNGYYVCCEIAGEHAVTDAVENIEPASGGKRDNFITHNEE